MRSLLLLVVTMVCTTAHAQCEVGNLLSNGGMTGTEAESAAVPGWAIVSQSPDINDEVGPVNTTMTYVWVGSPTASPTGGTWQNMAPSEAISQDVPTTIGATYSICFDHCAQAIHSDEANTTYDQESGMAIHADTTLVVATALFIDHYVWHHACGSFVASDDMTTITVEAIGYFQSYGAIDGLCMQLDTHQGLASIPEAKPALAPNPASSVTRVSGSHTAVRATATSTSGQVFALQVSANTLELAAVQPGIYTVQCWFADETAPLTQRLLVERQ